VFLSDLELVPLNAAWERGDPQTGGGVGSLCDHADTVLSHRDLAIRRLAIDKICASENALEITPAANLAIEMLYPTREALPHRDLLELDRRKT
jgi:hypothetical protein